MIGNNYSINRNSENILLANSKASWIGIKICLAVSYVRYLCKVLPAIAFSCKQVLSCDTPFLTKRENMYSKGNSTAFCIKTVSYLTRRKHLQLPKMFLYIFVFLFITLYLSH